MEFDMDSWSPMAPGAWDLDIPTTLYREPAIFDNDLTLPPAPLLVSKEWMKPKEHYVGYSMSGGFIPDVKEEVSSVDDISEESQSVDCDDTPAPLSPHFTPSILRAPRLGCRPLLQSPSSPQEEETAERSPSPSIPLEGTRAPLPPGYCALGLQFPSATDALPSPPPSPSPRDRGCRRACTPTMEREAEYQQRSRCPEPRRASTDVHSDLCSRVSLWRGDVAAATSVSTTLPNPSTMELACTSDLDVAMGSLHVRAPSEELDPWASRIGRSRGRAFDLPSGRRF